jgi:predicted acylesterase/phospholipase RssA
MVGMLFQSAMMLLRAASRNQNFNADVMIEPPIAHIRPDEIAKREELIELGEKAALEKMDAIKALIGL